MIHPRVCSCMCLSVCPHGKTKTTETTVTKLDTGIVHHKFWLAIHLILDQKVKVTGSQSAKIQLKAIEWLV